jgi:DNA-binding HxlR family transcriptional regulator
MKSYRQRCGLAKALDVIGDRWSLLIVRELIIRDACRYTDLREGLPGIATNLLADRLRELEAAGVIARETAPAPVATTVFRLTKRGRALEPALMALGAWGAPLLADAAPDEAMLGHWLVMPLRLRLTDRAPDQPPAVVELRAAGQPITVTAEAGSVGVRLGAAPSPDAVVSGDAGPLLALMTGSLAPAAAAAAGLVLSGDLGVLSRLIPAARA